METIADDRIAVGEKGERPSAAGLLADAAGAVGSDLFMGWVAANPGRRDLATRRDARVALGAAV
jgi:hypothetical protein